MRVATCTPVDFTADEHFFGRDSGLLSRGLQKAGVDSISIMPGKGSADEPPDMLRATVEHLKDEKWWGSLRLDFVVLYAWGNPIHREIATAIRAAGIYLIQNLDTAGIESPLVDRSRWWVCLRDMIAGPQPVGKKLRLLLKGARDMFPAMYEKRRLEMIDESDLVAAVSPPAAKSMKRFAEALGFASIARKFVVIPHPVPDFMAYAGESKADTVLCVGRWLEEDVHQKDPRMLLEALTIFLRTTPGWSASIVGRGIVDLARQLPADLKKRITLTSAVPRDELKNLYLGSKILFCPSRYESFHISSAEAVCCGCSVVVADHPLLSSTTWFTGHDSGTLAKRRDARSLAESLAQEANEWARGKRDPAAISHFWTGQLHASRIAARILEQVANRDSAPDTTLS